MAITAQPKSNSGEQAKTEGPAFAIQRIYTKDISFESPNTPDLFREEWKPNMHLDFGVNSNKLEDKTHEVVLTVTATVKNNEKSAFLAEIHQAGIFSIDGFDDEQLHRMLGAYCPNVLFPYAREAISDLVNRGGFPQLYLTPVNFDAVYEQSLKQQQEEQAAKAKTKTEKTEKTERTDKDK